MLSTNGINLLNISFLICLHKTNLLKPNFKLLYFLNNSNLKKYKFFKQNTLRDITMSKELNFYSSLSGMTPINFNNLSHSNNNCKAYNIKNRYIIFVIGKS